MVSGFKKRKIITSKTLGEVLSAAREEKGLTLEEAEVGSKVRIKYLSAIESGSWQSLPSVVYIRGFVLAYAKFLDLDRDEIETLFAKEYGFIDKTPGENLTTKKLFSKKKVLITPKLVAYSFFSVFLLLMFGYIFYQVIGFAGSPLLRIVYPNNNTILEADTLNVRGVADNNDLLTINNENVPVTTDGSFSTNIKLQRGINVVKVKATNRAKKETSEIITVEYKPKTAMIDLPDTANQ